MDKISDFGVHANAYYPLKVEIYKTKLDEKLLELLWNKYWVATLSQSLLISARLLIAKFTPTNPCQNRQYATSQVNDLNSKLYAATHSLGTSTTALRLKAAPPSKGQVQVADGKDNRGQGEYAGVEEDETPLTKASRDTWVISKDQKPI